MTAPYSDDQRAVAKAMVLAFGSAPPAREAIELLSLAPDSKWPGVPTVQALNLWRRDPSITPSTELVEQFGKELRLTVHGHVAEILGELKDYILEAIGTKGERGKALDILNLVKSYGITVDKVQPSRYGGTSGMNIFPTTGAGGSIPPGTGVIIMPFGPKALEPPNDKQVIDEDGNAVA